MCKRELCVLGVLIAGLIHPVSHKPNKNMQINELSAEATSLGDNDLFGVDVYNGGTSYTTKKVKKKNVLNELVYTATATDETQTEMLVNGERVVVPENATWFFSIM